MSQTGDRAKLHRECVRLRYWVIAAVAALVLFPQPEISRPAIYLLLAVWLGYNFLATRAGILSQRLGFFAATLLIDSAAILAIVHFSGGFTNQFHLLYLAPILMASFRWGLAAGLTAVTAASIFSIAYAAATGIPAPRLPIDLAVPLLTYLGVGLLAGLQGDRMVREEKQLKTVAGMSAAILAEGTLGEALTVLCRRVASLVSAEAAVILLYVDGQRLEAQWPAVGISKMETSVFGVELPPATQAGSYFRGNWSPAAAAKQAEALETFLHRFGVTSALLVPIATKGRVLGFFLTANKAGGSAFSSEDEMLLHAASSQAAVAISNARLYAGLTHEKSRLEGILRNMGDAVIVVDCQGKVSMTNPCAEASFGFSGDLIVGLPLAEALASASDPVCFPDLEEGLNQVLKARKIYQAEAKVGTGAAEASYHLTFAPMSDGSGDLVGGVAVFSEITQLKQVDRLKSEFVSTVSHELQTPLTAIKGYVETLLREDVRFEPARQRRFLDTIKSETDRLINLVTNLLDLSRIEAGAAEYRFDATDISQLLDERAGYARPRTDKHRIVVQIPEGLPAARADRTMIAHVIDNLVANAIKYSPEGGTIILSAQTEPETIAVSVADQGIGIPSERLPRIFGKFERGDSKEVSRVGGTGLGLFIVRSIIEAHGGSIAVRSTPGKGSVFTFRLARVQKEITRLLAG